MNKPSVFMQVRRATADDAATISALNADVHALHVAAHPHIFKPYSPETFPSATVRELMAAPANVFFLAEEDGEAVGYLYAEILQRPETPFRYAQDEIHVHQISVKPAHRRQGHGERLMAAAKALMQAHNIAMLTLSTWAFNQTAQAFFAKQGFTSMMHRLWFEDGELHEGDPVL